MSDLETVAESFDRHQSHSKPPIAGSSALMVRCASMRTRLSL
jgi:hypothetical protein